MATVIASGEHVLVGPWESERECAQAQEFVRLEYAGAVTIGPCEHLYTVRASR